MVSCGKTPVALDGFDAERWKNDRDGCGGYRTESSGTILEQRQKLLGFNEIEMVDILGRPDTQEIFKRHQKFYYYFIEPGPDCAGGGAQAKRLVIRFNAVGLSKEVLVE